MYETSYILDGMEKYFPNFVRDEFEEMEKTELESICRAYYKENLPVDITTWYGVNEPDEKLIYGKNLGDQVVFVRNKLMRHLFFRNIHQEYDSEKYDAFQPMVISEHVSKSVRLPIMEINLSRYGVRMILRNNFYDWCVSVESEEELHLDHKGLITDAKGYFEGFPADRVYESFNKNKSRFSFCLRDDFELYTFMYLLRDYLEKREEERNV